MLNETAFTKVSLLLTGLDATWMERPGDLDGKKDMLVKYFHRTLRTHNSYVFKFVFCEILNLVNILAQVKIDDILWLITIDYLHQKQACVLFHLYNCLVK